jgi:ArsR family transcriptional regulator
MTQLFTDGSYGHHDEDQGIEQLRRSLPDDETSSRMALIGSGFADQNRIRLLCALAQGPVCVGDLALALQIAQSTVSHQLRLLKTMGVVASSRNGRHVFYSLLWPGAAELLDALRVAVDGSEDWQNPAFAGGNIEEGS